MLHAFGQLTGLLEGGLIRNGLRVEDDDVGITAFLKTPLLFRHRCGIFDDLGGDQGAFPDGIHPTQHSTLPDPSPQEVAVVPCSARVALQSLGEGPFIAQEPCPFLVGEGDRIGDDGPARIKHRHIQQTGVMGVIVFIQEVDDDGVSGTGLHILHKLLFVLEGRIRFHQGEVVEVDSHPHFDVIRIEFRSGNRRVSCTVGVGLGRHLNALFLCISHDSNELIDIPKSNTVHMAYVGVGPGRCGEAS